MKLNIIDKLLSRIAYIAQGTKTLVYDSKIKNAFLSQKGDAEPWVVILGRKHYTENQFTYPIGDLKESIKAAKFEHSDEKSVHFFKSYQIDEQSSSVVIWSIEKELIEKLCSNAFFIIPESFLFAEKDKLSTVTLSEDEKTYISQSIKGPVSYCADDFITDEESFIQLAEIAMPTNEVVINETNFTSSLLEFSKLNLIKNIHHFFVGSSVQGGVRIPFKEIGIAFVSVVTIYNIILSSFLVYKESSVTAEFDNKRAQVDQVLYSQNELANQIELNQILSTEVVVDDTPWRAIEVVGSAVNAGMIITNVSYQSGEYRIAGVADKATTVLSLITSQDNVLEASFAGPIRESRTGERFGINFKTKAYE